MDEDQDTDDQRDDTGRDHPTPALVRSHLKSQHDFENAFNDEDQRNKKGERQKALDRVPPDVQAANDKHNAND